jgi:hypothetical protein
MRASTIFSLQIGHLRAAVSRKGKGANLGVVRAFLE